jgi:hypothetical protein
MFTYSVPSKRPSQKKIPKISPAGGTGSLEAPKTSSAFKRFLKILGPGLITGASDDDLPALAPMLLPGLPLDLQPSG